MKNISAFALIGALFAVCGCNPDQSGNMRGPEKLVVPAGSNIESQNPYVPDSVKKTLSKATGMPTAGR